MLYCLKIQNLQESYDLYIQEYKELGVECARMLMLEGNEYIGVDGYQAAQGQLGRIQLGWNHILRHYLTLAGIESACSLSASGSAMLNVVSMMREMGFQCIGTPYGQKSKSSHRNAIIEKFPLWEYRSIVIRASISPRKAVERAVGLSLAGVGHIIIRSLVGNAIEGSTIQVLGAGLARQHRGVE